MWKVLLGLAYLCTASWSSTAFSQLSFAAPASVASDLTQMSRIQSATCSSHPGNSQSATLEIPCATDPCLTKDASQPPCAPSLQREAPTEILASNGQALTKFLPDTHVPLLLVIDRSTVFRGLPSIVLLI